MVWLIIEQDSDRSTEKELEKAVRTKIKNTVMTAIQKAFCFPKQPVPFEGSGYLDLPPQDEPKSETRCTRAPNTQCGTGQEAGAAKANHTRGR